jgi:hypothetical protein
VRIGPERLNRRLVQPGEPFTIRREQAGYLEAEIGVSVASLIEESFASCRALLLGGLEEVADLAEPRWGHLRHNILS